MVWAEDPSEPVQPPVQRIHVRSLWSVSCPAHHAEYVTAGGGGGGGGGSGGGGGGGGGGGVTGGGCGVGGGTTGGGFSTQLSCAEASAEAFAATWAKISEATSPLDLTHSLSETTTCAEALASAQPHTAVTLTRALAVIITRTLANERTMMTLPIATR
ncbi:hypothetical protein A3F38_02880 [Candidatus Saccharibacteria bacterium RIFCSPHIGHO2_12_FULL_48_21]|nr:MAG: hypothetical protein A3F38_02880 [Candidatus Saccharibacteria bacterium RIFCSPHIGHO2_12_FULL_48_21]